jgi:hypothetical protein
VKNSPIDLNVDQVWYGVEFGELVIINDINELDRAVLFKVILCTNDPAFDGGFYKLGLDYFTSNFKYYCKFGELDEKKRLEFILKNS